MIKIIDKAKCCGCTACAEKCPKKCIEMKADEEGFLYPVVNEDECVNCGACDRVCPIQNPIEEVEYNQKGYLVQHKNDDIRLESTAGGAFTAIATVVIKKGGVVFGATYDNDFQVIHTYVEKEQDLYKFRNSKYVQSNVGKSFEQVKHFLLEDRWVCFSGTPCQIEGLNKYLSKKYDKLVLVDVVCHGIPSPLVWKKYLEVQKEKFDDIKNIRFRDKHYGYKYSTMEITSKNKEAYRAGSQLDPMLRAFFSDMSDRPCCYDCKFKKRYRVSDMTIWDCFTVHKFDSSLDDDKGTTRMLCHTEKGMKIAEEMKDFSNCKEISADQLVQGVNEMFKSVTPNPKRKEFFIDANKMSGKELFNKYYPMSASVKVKTAIRKALLVTGAYGLAKKAVDKVKGR